MFVEDSGTYERYADVDWPRLGGAEDFRRLGDSPDGLVLLARDADTGDAVGLLMAYATDASPTRQPIRYAVLRTMYVAGTHRCSGVGRRLVDTFLVWARDLGCVEAQVNHYVANENAGRLYERAGFEAHSLNRVLHLD